MNKNVILIRIGEIFLKGKNYGFFEKKLICNIKAKLIDFDFEIVKLNNRIFLTDYSEENESRIVDELKTVFGIHSISIATMMHGNVDAIESHIDSLRFGDESFRVSVNRADKRFPFNSTEYGARLGQIILKNNPSMSVDLHTFKINICVDIRENGQAFIYDSVIDGAGGMPVGSSGSGLLLLSGGIDSPVAGVMMAKRGMPISALHFHSYPYTSENAKQKVIKLAKIISRYTGAFKLYIVSFTKIQEEIHAKCNSEYMITIMRRIMLRISEKLAMSNNIQSVITGENLGQVASQTVESMTVTNDVMKTLPIFRPLIAFDKSEIIQYATKIDSYETSILPYEDCCTVFLPKHPVIRPTIGKCLMEESKLDIDALIQDALDNVEIIEI